MNNMNSTGTNAANLSVDIAGVRMNILVKTSLALMTLILSSITLAAALDDSVERGRYIAYAGDCAACHNVDGGDDYAGGHAFPTPFGIVYSTNITPDKTHGIGGYLYDDFVKVMREGIAPRGNLYPAMPFTSFHRVTDRDLKDLWRYLQIVPASSTPNVENTMIFPANIRFGLKAWNLLFLDSAGFVTNSKKSKEWNRGAYLVEGLAHCGECHTPRNIAMAMDESKALSGGFLGNMNALDITPAELRKQGWSRTSLVDLFHTGHSAQGVVNHEMLEAVSNSFSHLTIDDLNAVATYLLDDSDVTAVELKLTAKLTNKEKKDGKVLFTHNCSGCHGVNGEGSTIAPALQSNASVKATDPNNLIIFILEGIPKSDITMMAMPGYSEILGNEQIVSLSNYIRLSWGVNQKITAEKVQDIRQSLLDSGQITLAK